MRVEDEDAVHQADSKPHGRIWYCCETHRATPFSAKSIDMALRSFENLLGGRHYMTLISQASIIDGRVEAQSYR